MSLVEKCALGLVLLFLLAACLRLLRQPLKLALRVLINSALGFCALWVLLVVCRSSLRCLLIGSSVHVIVLGIHVQSSLLNIRFCRILKSMKSLSIFWIALCPSSRPRVSRIRLVISMPTSRLPSRK